MAWNTEEGKEPMSVELLKAVSGWLLNYNTLDGVWAHCFLLLTWNLMCRSENTALIKFSDIVWSTSFDSFHIRFGHTKTDQRGEHSKYPRHIYANPTCALLCPLTSLSYYFSCCFNSRYTVDCLYLFAGTNQEVRFSKIFKKVLQENEEAVRRLGFEIHELGTHSIRKGACTYLTSLPGGPSAIATSLRGGWSMGNVQDRYFRYNEAGDQYVGRCLSLNPVLSINLASSPPYFVDTVDAETDEWINGVVCSQFPFISEVPGFGKLVRMCTSSLIYHQRWIVESLCVNHVVRVSSYILRNAEALERFARDELITVTYPWNDATHTFSGVPPHVSLLQELRTVRMDQLSLMNNFVDKVKEGLHDFGVNADRMSEARLRQILDEFETTMTDRMNVMNRIETGLNRNNNSGNHNEQDNNRIETGGGYRLHYYDGIYHRVPVDWRFPRCGVYDLWRQWYIGDTVRQIPPLRFVQTVDVVHLNIIGLTRDELHGRTGKYKQNRRKIRQTMSDMKVLMNYIKRNVMQRNRNEDVITILSVDRMFGAIADLFRQNVRDVQIIWTTVLKNLRVAGKIRETVGE